MNCKVCCNTTTNTPGISFFRFPKEGKKCERWAELCHLKCLYGKKGTIQFHKSFRICSEHFDADEMMHDGRKVRLFPSAEPKFLLKKYRKIKRKKKAVIKKLNIAKITLPNHFCRLCGEEKKDVISIYGWRGKTTYDLEKKLKYFPFAIDKCDVLPLGVCQECVVKVDQFFEFIEDCIKAQTKLKELLNDKIHNLTVQLVDSADSNLVPNQETHTRSGSQEQIQGADTGEEQNTTLDADLINIDLLQLLNGDKTQTPNVDEIQNTSFAIPFQLPPDLYHYLMNFPIIEKNQTEQDCPEPEPDLMKFTDDDLITLYDDNDNKVTLHSDPNLNCTYADVPTSDQFPPPPQSTDQADVINTNFDNINELNCDVCLKEFETPEMLNSHLIAHSVETNDNDFAKYTTVDFLPDFIQEISKKAKESDWRRDFSNTEPLKEEPERAGSLPKRNKPSLKRKGKKRRKTKPECEFCEKLFPTLDECEEHEKTHQGIQRYECLICQAKFRSKRGLRRHIPVHSGEIFPCPHCKTIFRRKDSLQNHGRIHRKLTCKICRFVFKQKAEFLKHEKDHELPVGLSTELYDAGQAEKESCEPDLPHSISKRDKPVSEAPDEFLANIDTIQPTCISVPASKMDDIEQIVMTQIVAMEI